MSIDITKNDHMRGLANAPVVLVEYGDFQCPYCRDAYYILQRVKKQLGDRILFVFRNFPLMDLHPQAVEAALAAEVSAKQDKFWEMHDMLFENQKALERADLMEYAHRLHLNMIDFQEGFEQKEHLDKIKSDFKSGVNNGVQGTPTFFINGELFEGDWSSSQFISHLRTFV